MCWHALRTNVLDHLPCVGPFMIVQGCWLNPQCHATKTQGCAWLCTDRCLISLATLTAFFPAVLIRGSVYSLSVVFSTVLLQSPDFAVVLVQHATDITFKLNLICPCVERTNHNVSASNALCVDLNYPDRVHNGRARCSTRLLQ